MNGKPLAVNAFASMYLLEPEIEESKVIIIKRNITEKDVDIAIDNLLETFHSDEITNQMIGHFWSIKLLIKNRDLVLNAKATLDKWTNNFHILEKEHEENN